MLYAFIIGKNKSLSKEELSCYFEKEGVTWKIMDEGNEFLIIESEKIDPLIIKDLGGTIKIGKVMSLEHIEFDGPFGVSVYGGSFSLKKETGMMIKKKMKALGIKTKFFQTRQTALTAVEVLKKNLIGREILVLKGSSMLYAITESVYDPFEYKRLDMDRPKQRGMYSISIRLSKILINLAKLKKGQTMLDPFCGYGTILQAGMLSGLNVYGTDNDDDCIKSSEENIQWLKEKYGVKGDHALRKVDVKDIDREFEHEKFDAVISEAYLGPPLRKSVRDMEAGQIIADLSGFYDRALNKLSHVLRKGGRIVIVLPLIVTKRSKFKVTVQPKGLNFMKSIEDVSPKHITGRDIYIFEK